MGLNAKGAFIMKKKSKKIVSKNYEKYMVSAVVLAAIIILAVILLGKGSKPAVKGNIVNVDLYVMSKCPYGVQAMDFFAPVLSELGSSVNFNLNYIARDNGNGSFDSLHGPTEVRGDTVELCAVKYEPGKYMDLITCMNQDAASIPDNWQDCAKKLGLNSNSIKTCYEGAEGKQLLSDSIKKSDAANAQGSPTIIINGQDYSGQRDTLSLKRAICKYSTSSACSAIPTCGADSDCAPQDGKVALCKNPNSPNSACEYQDDAKTQLTVINEKTCNSCDSTQVVLALKKIFLNMDVKDVDASSDEGKQIIKDMGITVAPSFVFDSNIVKTYAWQNNEKLRTVFEQKNGNYKILDAATGASFYIDAKAREEFLKKAGITLNSSNPQIDFFVMSYCPYGNLAEEAVSQVYDNLKGKGEFNPHYVIYENYQSADFCLDSTMKYCSMHGKQEVHQDVREICVNKYMGIKSWFDFAKAMNSKCTAQNADSCWEDVAKGIGLDVQKIKDCESNESEALLQKEKDLDSLLGVQGSPTIFIEGAAYNGARDANSIQSALCSAFGTKPTECANSIAGTNSTATSPTAGCGA